jgi:hypothetical protein
VSETAADFPAELDQAARRAACVNGLDDDLRVRHPVLQSFFIKASSGSDGGDLV